MNELEKEKQSILAFMEEIEKKKRAVFMELSKKMTAASVNYFAKLTGGGAANPLVLENPEDPFAGGMDMQVQFRNKASILVSGASSGERSVSASCIHFCTSRLSCPQHFMCLMKLTLTLTLFTYQD